MLESVQTTGPVWHVWHIQKKTIHRCNFVMPHCSFFALKLYCTIWQTKVARPASRLGYWLIIIPKYTCGGQLPTHVLISCPHYIIQKHVVYNDAFISSPLLSWNWTIPSKISHTYNVITLWPLLYNSYLVSVHGYTVPTKTLHPMQNI